jgi:hypothetical protein
MDGRTKGERILEGVQSKPTLPLQPWTERPQGESDEDLSTMILHNRVDVGMSKMGVATCCNNVWMSIRLT